ncbi:MAG TPA: hypothetical protein VNM66_01980, partial [Thermodesulfobacteriota bacterium]|nr:hypothetical protein [Thermodesulfobacteriota bacterium]
MDGVLEGRWGAWVVEVAIRAVEIPALRGLFACTRRLPRYRPLVLPDADGQRAADRLGVAAMARTGFLRAGPPRRRHGRPAPRPRPAADRERPRPAG